MDDKLSEVHFRAVRNEIEGRFFSLGEADLLKYAIDSRTLTDPHIRKLAAKSWAEVQPK